MQPLVAIKEQEAESRPRPVQSTVQANVNNRQCAGVTTKFSHALTHSFSLSLPLSVSLSPCQEKLSFFMAKEKLQLSIQSFAANLSERYAVFLASAEHSEIVGNVFGPQYGLLVTRHVDVAN